MAHILIIEDELAWPKSCGTISLQTGMTSRSIQPVRVPRH